MVPLAFFKFVLNYKHLLVSLLCLEFISLRFFIGLTTNLRFFNLESVFILYFLVIVVCEGVLGLCLLVILSFYYGRDYLFVFNKLVC